MSRGTLDPARYLLISLTRLSLSLAGFPKTLTAGEGLRHHGIHLGAGTVLRAVDPTGDPVALDCGTVGVDPL